MTLGTGIPLIDGLCLFVGAFVITRAALTLVGNVWTFISYRRMDGKTDAGIRD